MANILLRAFALGERETKDFYVYDWDNNGEGFVNYTIRVRHAGREKVQVPAGTFEANHLVLTQMSSADTWFKKRAGDVTEFWVLDNHAIVRVLRHREPYEMTLLDYTVPEKLMSESHQARTPQRNVPRSVLHENGRRPTQSSFVQFTASDSVEQTFNKLCGVPAFFD